MVVVGNCVLKDEDVTLNDDCACTNVDELEQELVGDEYTDAVYEGVPPDHAALNVILWPLSSVCVVDGLIDGVPNAGLTDTVSVGEFAVADDESVTM